MAADIRLKIGSDNDIYLNGLKDTRTSSYINDATVTFSLLTTAGAVFDSQSNIAMSYQSSSNGQYIGVLAQDAAIVDGAEYIVEITVVASSSRDLKIRKTAIAEYAGMEE